MLKALITLDLPFPPSQNRIWRSTGRARKGRKVQVYRSKPYMDWLKAADGHWLMQKPKGVFPTIEGQFEATLILARPDKRNRDGDNYAKVIFDWAQRVKIIANDCNCQRSIVEWGLDEEAPLGACLIIKEL